MQKISPFLWFNDNAEEAANLYVSLFRDAKITSISRYGDGAPLPAGTAMSVTFELEGLEFKALNGGPHYTFSPATSFYVDCETQEEVDSLWDKLAEGGQVMQCGWLTDRFGVTWQIIPRILGELLQSDDDGIPQRTMAAMMQMTKIDIAKLKQAAANG